MKDWEWFALGLIPFAGFPVHLLRYEKEDHVPSGLQLVAGAAASQGLAYGLQRATGYKVADHLAYYRLRSLGFQLQASSSYWSGGPLWRMPFLARMASPLIVASIVGSVANVIASDQPYHQRQAYAHQRQAKMQGMGPSDYI